MPRIRLFLTLALALLLLSAAPAAQASPSGIVVDQVFAGGGNAGASYANDFVELFNAGSGAVNLTGWTIQYASAASTSWQATLLSGSIQAGGRYLVALASSGAVGASLPTPDATGTTNLAVSGGKVALVHDSTVLSCGAAAGSCSAVASVEDLVGYGSATDYEGSGPAAALDSTTAALRAGSGCTDTGDSAGDFSTATPDPRGLSAAPAVCSGGSSTSQTQDAAVDIDIQPVLSIALDHPSLSFGSAVAGDVPAPLPEQVTVVSNDQTGYALTVHRSAFTPADLPLGVAGSAPVGAQLGAPLSGGALAAVPVAPAADLVVGTSSHATAGGGDIWATSIGFTSALPVVPPGRYAATVTYTVIPG